MTQQFQAYTQEIWKHVFLIFSRSLQSFIISSVVFLDALHQTEEDSLSFLVCCYWQDVRFCHMLFLCYWDDHVFFFPFDFIDMVYYIDCFSYAEPTFILEASPPWWWYIIPFISCVVWHFVEDFCVYIHNRYWLSFLYCNVYIWFWHLSLIISESWHFRPFTALSEMSPSTPGISAGASRSIDVACVVAWSTGMTDSSAVPLICTLCSFGGRDCIGGSVAMGTSAMSMLLYSWIFLLPVGGV